MIDEKVLIEKMWNKFNSYYNDANRFMVEETEIANMVLSDVNKMLEEQPKVNEWIPCSKRLPEIEKDVLVTDKITGEVTIAQLNIFNCFMFEDGRGHGASAWMPLPEPYRE